MHLKPCMCISAKWKRVTRVSLSYEPKIWRLFLDILVTEFGESAQIEYAL